MFPRIGQFKNVAQFRRRLVDLGINLPVDDRILSAAEGSPLARPIQVEGFTIGNRWCIQPMEGWDAHADGSPSELTLRRWRRFGQSGAKLIWGGEAAAVVEQGRANPNQLLATAEVRPGLSNVLCELRAAHRQVCGDDADLLVGLQLTHSGRFAHPSAAGPQPRIAYHHPLLDARVGLDATCTSAVISDSEVERLIDQYVASARVAAKAGFQFVDVKACHGYLVHEFLSAFTRKGPFGGDFQGRTRLLLTIVERIRDEMPSLMVAVRLSAFDTPPYEGAGDAGRAMRYDLPYRFGFGLKEDAPLEADLREPLLLLQELQRRGVALLNISCGSPYYNPHLQRPAAFPPSDGYQPPEDPLIGVARQIDTARQIKTALPRAVIVGSGYSYLQEYLPHVAHAVVRNGWADCVGLGRMALAYPQLPADTLAGRPLARRRLCRTFSDCTTAPRNGLASGCYPLDSFYRDSPQARRLRTIKRQRS
jgi:2,4-dienoyl-CoA reductase-like NADH-dependent reductase (Old Yellow Enzyme family)